MHKKLFFSVFCGAMLAIPALAQEAAPGIEIAAPILSDTEDATPEWYKRFTFGSQIDESPIWKALPNNEFGLAWTKGERWSLNIDLSRHNEGTPLPHEEMSAGATFKITPRISVGGQLSIGERRNEDTSLAEDEQQVETGIRLQSAFKF
ncbi:MAG: hypothetical protein V3V03_05125 [Hyphomonadaceae bacterium]